MTQGFGREQRQWVGLASAGLTFAFALAHAALGDWLDAGGALGSSVLALALVALDRELPGGRLTPWLAGLSLTAVFTALSALTGSPLYLAFLGLTALLTSFLQGNAGQVPAVLTPVLAAVPLGVWLALEGQVPAGGAPAEALRGAALLTFLLLTGLAYERMRDEALARAVAGERRAVKAGQSQSRLLERVSHALAEPLHGVLDVARGLGTQRLPEAVRQDLAVLHGSAASMLALVSDLILLAGGRSGAAGAHAAPVDLGERTDLAVGRWRAAAEAAGSALRWTRPGAPLPLRVDPGALELVLDRMLGHALAAAGTAPLAVEVLGDGPRGGAVEIRGGPPLTEAEIHRAFLPFAEGQDLRLATAREVANTAGGSLVLVPGRPLQTLRLELPAEPPARPPDAAPAPPRPGAPDAWRRAFTVQLVGTLAGVSAASVLAYLALGSLRDAAVAGGVLAVTVTVKVLVGRGRWNAATAAGALGLSVAFATGAALTGSGLQVGYLGVSAVAMLFIGGLGHARVVLGALGAGAGVALLAVARAPGAAVTLVEVARAVFVIPTLLLIARSYEGARARALHEALRAQALAEAASEEQTRFLQGASHQLRTPLNGILGMAQTLWGEVPTLAARREVEALARCATAMHSRVNELIDVARAGAGEVLLAPAPVEAAVMLEDVVALHRPAAEGRGLVLSSALPPAGRWVQADESRLRQVLGALLANAVAFTSQGRVTVEASLEAAAEGPALLTVDVSDTGPGVPPGVAAALAPGGRLEPGPGGVGLDLAIARELMLAMGGSLALLSTGPTGSTFRLQVLLPRAAAPALPSPLPAPWPARVLVVDDNPVNRAVASRLLARLGAEAVVVPSGEAAVVSAELERFDLVLMDLQMPGLDGFETTRRLRARGVGAPVVALTASAQPETPGQCREAGMADCLVKPVKLEQLADLLEGVLERRVA